MIPAKVEEVRRSDLDAFRHQLLAAKGGSRGRDGGLQQGGIPQAGCPAVRLDGYVVNREYR